MAGKFFKFDRRAAIRLAVVFLTLGIFIGMARGAVSMPGKSYSGPREPLTEKEKADAARLREHVETLSVRIGKRNLENYENYQRTASWLEEKSAELGYKPERRTYKAPPGFLKDARQMSVQEQEYSNIILEARGKKLPEEIIVVGAHYDSVPVLRDCPGADDNASGVAGVLLLAEKFRGVETDRTLRFVFFANEEPPFFQTPAMGSHVYARECKERNENIRAAVALDAIGCFSEEADSQHYPPPLDRLYPHTGNFVAFVGNVSSVGLVRKCVGIFRRSAKFPSEGAALPDSIPGVGFSDHWSFWQFGYKGVMVTDTAMFRNNDYHSSGDTAEKLDYGAMARIVGGLELILKELAKEK